MVMLKVAAQGHVALPRDVQRHLGVKPGDQIDLDLMPNGRVMLKASQLPGSIDDFIDLLAGKTKKTLTIEEMNKLAAAGWAGKRS